MRRLLALNQRMVCFPTVQSCDRILTHNPGRGSQDVQNKVSLSAMDLLYTNSQAVVTLPCQALHVCTGLDYRK